MIKGDMLPNESIIANLSEYQIGWVTYNKSEKATETR